MGQGTPRYVFEIKGTFSVCDCSNRKKNEVMVMPKVFNIMQYCKHPITGEVLITEEQIKGLFERRTIKRPSEELGMDTR